MMKTILRILIPFLLIFLLVGCSCGMAKADRIEVGVEAIVVAISYHGNSFSTIYLDNGMVVKTKAHLELGIGQEYIFNLRQSRLETNKNVWVLAGFGTAAT